MGSPPLKPAGLPTTEDQFGFNRDGRRRKREDLGRGFDPLPCTNKKRRAVEEYRTFKVCLAPDDTRRFTIPLYRSWGRFEALLRAEYPWAFDLPEEGDDVVMIRYEDESRDLCILSSQSEWEALCHNRLLGPIVRLRITHEKPRFPSVKPEPMHDGDDEDSNEAEAMRATDFERDDDEDELALARSRDRAMMYSCWSSFQPPPPFLDKNINNGSQEGRGSLSVKVEARHRLGDQVKDGPCTKHNREAREASADATVGLNDVSAAAVTTTTTTSSATTPPLVMMTDSRKKRAMVQIKIERADDDSDNAMMYSNRDAEPQEAEPKEEEEDDEENDEKKEVKAEGEEEADGMLGIFSRWTPGWMRLFRASSPLLVDPETFPPAAPEGGAEDEAQPEPEPEVERDHDQAVDRDESLLRKRRWRSSSDVRRSSSDGSRRRLRRSSSSSAAE